MTHEEAQGLIPAYAASRLEGAELDALRAHLGGCEACSELATGIGEIAAAIASGGEGMLDPHPEESQLRAHALGRHAEGAERVRRHLESCARCSLEVASWRGGTPGPGRSELATGGRASSSWRQAAALLAAGVVLGMGLTALWHRSFGPGTDGMSPSAWSGPVDLHLLPAPTRGEESLAQFRLRKGQPATILHLRRVLPDPHSPDERFRVIIRAASGATVYERVHTRAEMERDFDQWEVMPIYVPAAPGKYELILMRETAPAERVLESPFELVPEG